MRRVTTSLTFMPTVPCIRSDCERVRPTIALSWLPLLTCATSAERELGTWITFPRAQNADPRAYSAKYRYRSGGMFDCGSLTFRSREKISVRRYRDAVELS